MPARHLLPTTYYLTPITYNLQLTTYYLLPTTYYLLPGVPVKLSLALSTQGTLELMVTFTPIGMAPSAATMLLARSDALAAAGKKGDAAFGKRERNQTLTLTLTPNP